MKRFMLLFALILAMASVGAGRAAAEEVKIGALGNTGDGPLLIAVERGYFKERGIEAKFEQFSSAAAAVAPLATGQLQVVGGGVGPALFNAFARGLPIRIVAPRAIDVPGNSVDALMVRPDLKDKVRSMADLAHRMPAHLHRCRQSAPVRALHGERARLRNVPAQLRLRAQLNWTGRAGPGREPG